jgi:hypothetical protein
VQERHEIVRLAEKVSDFQKRHCAKEGEIYSAVATAPAAAYLQIAYGLYVLKHNVGLQKFMIVRLKQKDLFQGARYELYVAASLIKGGFAVEYEDETDKRNRTANILERTPKPARNSRSRRRASIATASGALSMTGKKIR